MKLQPYIMLNGNAREAMNFYKEALGAEITFVQTYGEADPSCDTTMKEKIMHANIKGDDFELMVSDGNPQYGTIVSSDAVNISVALDSAEKGKQVFDALSVGGEISMPFEKQFWGGNLGMFKDKFGISWMVNTEAPKV